MIVEAFLADVGERPAALRRLATRLRDEHPWAPVVPAATRRVRLLGMGSSGYAAEAVALRARMSGLNVVADLATVRRGWSPGDGTLVVAVSASGSSAETLSAARRDAGPWLAALTNAMDGDLADLAGAGAVGLATADSGGVSALSYTATLVLLLALVEALIGEVPGPTGSRPALADAVERAADAADGLLTQSTGWLPEIADLLDGPDGPVVLAPAERLASARQSALMVREVPRRPATGCETGDWAHVDVYLTRTLDYRALVLGGSPWEGQALEWLTARRARVVGVGPVDPGRVRYGVRYPGDRDDLVALLVETTIAELLAERWYTTAGQGPPVSR